MDSDPRAGGSSDIPAQPPAAPPPGPSLPPGAYPPPPPPPRYPAAPNGAGHADIPATSPEHYSQTPPNRGAVGWLGGAGAAVLGLLKYGGLVLLKFPLLLTSVTFLGSFLLYAWAWGPWAAAGIVLMILVHELGHVFEIQRQGLRATAPIFIPFMGAAIFQRQHPTDAVKQAQIGIAGPIAGTIGATFAFAAFGSTHFVPFLLWAWFGFFINLINLVPAGMLDGGWILAPVSKWFQVGGLALIVLLVFAPDLLGLNFSISPIFLFVVILGLPATLARFRYAASPYYTSVPAAARWGLGISWLALVIYLIWATAVAEGALGQFVR